MENREPFLRVVDNLIVFFKANEHTKSTILLFSKSTKKRASLWARYKYIIFFIII